ncbi:Endoribonuclease YbeY [Planctomycetes bacterium Poly30]|uniref:Endoribonuclease YbeY n=1 Tax=Saltatorellus ferox TaxID=2528018 RepID=A0A518ER49_9BACT|nr:Endoribonuclease YbeY [Planctomycetes bacterium Poly30]
MSSFTWTQEAGEPFLSEAEALRALEAALEHGGRAGAAVDLVVVGARTLADMHGQFLEDPSETDVITFDLADDDLPADVPRGPEGEIYLSADRARDESARREVSAARELSLYIVHGALHLCGMDDHSEEDRLAMRLAERSVMARLGYAEDTAPHDRAE